MHKAVFNVLRRRCSVLLWAVFVVGVLLQAFSSHLKIKNNRFVLPPSLLSSSAEIRTDEIIARERRLQWISGVLTLGSALGLAACHRRVLFGGRSVRRDPADGSPSATTSSSNREAM
jgi:NhaP-type Na+/H+ or K+/H+ antiporter